MEALRILIVDDEDELVTALTERLTLRGFTATGVTTGEGALRLLEEEPFDVVLLDVKMPGLGGLDLIEPIKTRLSTIEVVLLTGHGSVPDVEKGMALGAFDYLMKPVKIDDLVTVLETAGAKHRS
jgi:DNA-binding NtrC family response regulator